MARPGIRGLALGVRVTHKPVTEFDTLAANARELFTTWYAALENK